MTTIKDDPDNNIESIFAEIQGVLHDLMREIRESNDLCLNYSIRVVDSGGQPQFHEIVYILLPAVTGILSVFKLSEHLDAHGDVDYYNKDGIEISDPFKSYLSNEQVIRHNILAIQSEASRGDIKNIPNLAFVGTFLDQQDACPEETPDKKDELLHSMISEILPEELQGSIISNSGSLRQVTFRVNARTPSDKDFETAGRLKVALMKQSQIKPKDLPLKWFGYEVALRKLMERFNRQTLSLHECEFIGYKLDFDQPSLKACLNYLRELHIITFYDVLPNVVFGSCQVILDKITELVIYSLKLKKGKIPVCGIERKFHQQGIISLQVLKSQDCSKHYNEHFTPDDLIKVLRSLYIIAEIKTGEYFMPCILEVSKIYPNPQLPKDTFRSSFILHFSKKIPMLGIYCCAISFLLTEAGWKFLTKGGEVVQVSRNSVTFELPRKCGGKVIFLDPLSSYLEVVVELPHIIIAEKEQRVILYREIRDTFFRAIKQALQTLHCEVMTPELTFLCHQKSSQCSTLPHIARLDDSNSFLTCSINSSSACHLTDDQKMWLPTPSKLNSSVEATKSQPDNPTEQEIQFGVNNSESEALRKCYKLLKEGPDPEYLVNVLYSKLFILTREERERVTLRMLTTGEKNEEIFKALERRVSVNPNVFHILLQTLKEEPALRPLGVKMQAIYNGEYGTKREHWNRKILCMPSCNVIFICSVLIVVLAVLYLFVV